MENITVGRKKRINKKESWEKVNGKDRFIYAPGEKTGMVLKMKWVEGSHYWESSIRILEKLYPELLEKKLQSWLDEYFKDFL